MNIAAVASEDAILPPLEGAWKSSLLNVTAIWAESSDLLESMQRVAPGATRLASWDELLNGVSIDAVLVAGVSDAVLAAARHLATQLKVRLLVVVSSSQNATRIFDYTAIWQDVPDAVVPIFVSGVEGTVQELREQFDEDTLGTLWKLDFKRSIESVQGDSQCLLELAQQWFLQDCAWMRELESGTTHVTMNATGPNPDAPIEVTIQLTGSNAVECNWTLHKGASAGWQLTLIGEHGQLTAECSRTSASLVNGKQGLSLNELMVRDTQAELERVTAGQIERRWSDLIKLGEFGATAARSLSKRRTLSVHFEEASERSQFKSQMAAIGCGALLWTMFGMIALLTMGAIFDPRDREYLTSSSADFVIRNADFVENQSGLTDAGAEHVLSIARQWSSSSPVVIVEADPDTAAEVNLQRRQRIVDSFTELRIRHPEQRVVLRTIEGEWFEVVMFVGWIVVFGPIILVLLGQLLIVFARPIE